jgi:3-oxoacyl-[acyl-carrier-protein] synthase-3
LSNNCLAFDVNLGCSGFVYGLNIVSSLLKSSNGKYGILLAGDSPSKGNRTDNSRNLFGDACSATLLEHREGCDDIVIASRSDGSGFRTMWSPAGAKHKEVDKSLGLFDEIGVFNFAIEQAPILINEFMESLGKSSADFDVLALHQANMMIMKQIVKRTHFEKEKMLVTIDKYANTSAASIPLCFVERYGGRGVNGLLRALVCGYGVGLSWAAGSLLLDTNVVMPLIKTDYWFDDGLNNYVK